MKDAGTRRIPIGFTMLLFAVVASILLITTFIPTDPASFVKPDTTTILIWLGIILILLVVGFGLMIFGKLRELKEEIKQIKETDEPKE